MADTWKVRCFDSQNMRVPGASYRDSVHCPMFDVPYIVDGTELHLTMTNYHRMTADLCAIFLGLRTGQLVDPDNGDNPTLALKFGSIATVKFWLFARNEQTDENKHR